MSHSISEQLRFSPLQASRSVYFNGSNLVAIQRYGVVLEHAHLPSEFQYLNKQRLDLF